MPLAISDAGSLMPSLSASGLVAFLDKGDAHGGGGHGALPPGDMGQGVPHEVDPAALPGGAEHLGGGRLEPLTGIRDDQLDATQPPARQGTQEVGPEDLCFRRPDGQFQDLAPALRVHRDGDYRRHRDDAPALPHLDVGGVEPQIGPIAFEATVEKIAHPLIDRGSAGDSMNVIRTSSEHHCIFTDKQVGGNAIIGLDSAAPTVTKKASRLGLVSLHVKETAPRDVQVNKAD